MTASHALAFSLRIACTFQGIILQGCAAAGHITCLAGITAREGAAGLVTVHTTLRRVPRYTAIPACRKSATTFS